MPLHRVLRFAWALAALTSALAWAAPDKKVVINPILAARDDGTLRAAFAAYVPYATKIWDQADIAVEFLAPTLLDDTDYWRFNYNNAWSLVNAPGSGRSSNPLVVNAWFASEIYNASVYGFAYLDQPFLVLDVGNILGYSTVGRVDTFSHELGHNLKLPHRDFSNALMCSGSLRQIPQVLGDVFPDGQGLDFLNQSEINLARSSRFLMPVPEPATLAVLGLGLLAVRKRRRR